MKKHNRGSGLGCSSRRMVVEQLEGRTMLAGNVTVSVSGGNLISTGDGNDEVAVIADVALNATINTGSGSDDVAFGNAASVGTDSTVGGSLIILTGGKAARGTTDFNHVCVDFATISGALVVNTGDGSNTVSAHEFDATSAVITTGNTAPDTIDLEDFTLDSALVVNAGNGINTLLLNDSDI